MALWILCRINDSTTNGPTLTNTDQFGFIENISDLNSDGVNDLAVGAYLDDEGGGARGAVHIMFMNTDGSVDSTVEINLLLQMDLHYLILISLAD